METQTTTTGVETASPTVPPMARAVPVEVSDAGAIFASGHCAICRMSIREHFNAENEWKGCPSFPEGEMHAQPLRRDTDRVLFVPVMAIGESLRKNVPTNVPKDTARRAVRHSKTREDATDAAPSKRTRRGTFKEAAARKRGSAKPKSAAGARRAISRERSDDSPGRGRTAGVYMLDKGTPKVITDSIKRIYDTIRGRKTGISAQALAERLQMPSGTVGWGLRHLKNAGAVRYVAATA